MLKSWLKKKLKEKEREIPLPPAPFPYPPVKPEKEQISVVFNTDASMEKSHPLYGDTNGLTYDYWG